MKISLTATPSASRFAPLIVRGQPAEAFALAAELGYDGVELHLRRPDDIDRRGVQELCTRYGLGIPTIGTGMAAGEDGLTFSDPDPAIRRRAIERCREHIDLAAAWHSAVTIGLIRGKLGPVEAERPRRREAQMACLAECCRAAADRGVTLLFEPLNRYEGDDVFTAAEGLGVLAEIGAPNLKLLLDTYHMNIEEPSFAAGLRQAGAHRGHVHLVDSNRQAPGHGHVPLPEVLGTLREIGFAGYVSFEVLPLPNPRQAAEDGIRTVRGALAAL
jgi:5-keto-L-gluconate epimerase